MRQRRGTDLRWYTLHLKIYVNGGRINVTTGTVVILNCTFWYLVLVWNFRRFIFGQFSPGDSVNTHFFAVYSRMRLIYTHQLTPDQKTTSRHKNSRSYSKVDHVHSTPMYIILVHNNLPFVRHLIPNYNCILPCGSREGRVDPEGKEEKVMGIPPQSSSLLPPSHFSYYYKICVTIL